MLDIDKKKSRLEQLTSLKEPCGKPRTAPWLDHSTMKTMMRNPLIPSTDKQYRLQSSKPEGSQSDKAIVQKTSVFALYQKNCLDNQS